MPRGFLKYIPSGKTTFNEAFKGLSKDDLFKLENWRFERESKDPEILSMIARGKAIYNPDCLDSVADDPLKNSWSI